jgi:hypothetical protein
MPFWPMYLVTTMVVVQDSDCGDAAASFLDRLVLLEVNGSGAAGGMNGSLPMVAFVSRGTLTFEYWLESWFSCSGKVCHSSSGNACSPELPSRDDIADPSVRITSGEDAGCLGSKILANISGVMGGGTAVVTEMGRCREKKDEILTSSVFCQYDKNQKLSNKPFSVR